MKPTRTIEQSIEHLEKNGFIVARKQGGFEISTCARQIAPTRYCHRHAKNPLHFTEDGVIYLSNAVSKA